MITLKTFMEIVDYRISGGSNYCWQCFGPDAYSLDAWNGDHNGYSLSVTFDTKTKIVYCTEACDYRTNRAYRMINPEYKTSHDNDVKNRGYGNEAWDDVNWCDLETEEDFEQKARAIVAGEDYDTRVTIPIDLPETELMMLFKMAHEADVTFNAYVEQLLRDSLEDEDFIDRLHKSKNDAA